MTRKYQLVVSFYEDDGVDSWIEKRITISRDNKKSLIDVADKCVSRSIEAGAGLTIDIIDKSTNTSDRYYRSRKWYF